MSDRLLPLAELKRKVGLGHTTIYKLIGEDRFPRPRQISPGRVAWRESEVDAWMEALPATGEPDRPGTAPGITADAA